MSLNNNNNDSRNESQRIKESSINEKPQYMSLLWKKNANKSSPDRVRLVDVVGNNNGGDGGLFTSNPNISKTPAPKVMNSGGKGNSNIKARIKKNHSGNVMDKI